MTDIKIVNQGDRTPMGYRSLSETMDDSKRGVSGEGEGKRVGVKNIVKLRRKGGRIYDDTWYLPSYSCF